MGADNSYWVQKHKALASEEIAYKKVGYNSYESQTSHYIAFLQMLNYVSKRDVFFKFNNVLDIGCGFGGFLQYIKENDTPWTDIFKGNFNYYGIDTTEDTLTELDRDFKNDFNVKKLYNVNFQEDDLNEIKEEFDIIYSLGVFYLMDKPLKELLSKTIEKLSIGGYFFITLKTADWEPLLLDVIKTPENLRLFSNNEVIKSIPKNCRIIDYSGFNLKGEIIYQPDKSHSTILVGQRIQ